MSPATHLLASWVVAAKTTDNPRDCRLVTWAGVLPDADGLGMAVDIYNQVVHHSDHYDLYGKYHHWLWHGAFGAVVTSLILAAFARQRGRVFLMCLVVFHLHLLCDLLGSRGPTKADIWPIFYLGPFSFRGVLVWDGQWQLDGWQNRIIGVALFLCALWMATKRSDSIIGVFNRRADRVVVGVLHNWREKWKHKRE